MIFTSLNDLYFFAAGIQGLNVITDIALETKLVLLPIILFILKELSKASQGDDEERVLLLKRLEIGVWTQIFVILVAFYPLVPVKVDGFALYAKQCEGYKEPKINKGFFAKGEKINDLQVMLSGGELKMPLLLSLAHTYGTGFSIESVDRLPCGINLQGVKSVLLENTIHDQRLLIETKHFIRRCYQPALNKAIRDPKNMLPWIEDPHTESQPWPGHEAFMNDEYYGAIGRGFYSDVLLPGWQGAKANKYNHWWMKSQQEERRGGCTTGDCIHQVGGFPSCQEWWHGIGAGWPGVHVSSNDMSLRKRLWDNLPEDDKDVIWPVLEQSFGNASRSDIWFQDKVVEKAYFSRVSMNRIMGAEPKDYGLEGGGAVKAMVGIITRLVGTVGSAATSAVEYAGASIVQNAAPLIKGSFMMVLLVVYPVVILVSQYGFKMAIMMPILYLSVQFWPFFWELTIVVQKSYLETVAASSNIPLLDILSNPNIALSSQRITDALFIIFPMIFSSFLSYAGLSIGGSVGNAGGLNKGNASAGSSGANKAGKAASSGAKKMATKGAAK